MGWWTGLTAPQATVFSGLITFSGALSAVLLAWGLFSARVNDLKSALKESRRELNEHFDAVRQMLSSAMEDIKGFNGAIGEMKVTLASLQEASGQLRGAVAELENAVFSLRKSSDQAVTLIQSTTPQEASIPNSDELRSDLNSYWSIIKDALEKAASMPSIGEEDRARYNRIDRRSYESLISSLSKDGRLGKLTDDFTEAAKTWLSFRNQRLPLTAADVSKMKELSQSIQKWSADH